MSFFGELISTIFEQRYHQALSEEVDNRTTFDLCDALLSSHGEVSGTALARNLLDRYRAMDLDERKAFFELITHKLEIKPNVVTKTLRAYQEKPSKGTYSAFARLANQDGKNSLVDLTRYPEQQRNLSPCEKIS